MPIQAHTKEASAETYPSLKFPEVGNRAMYRLAHAAVVEKTVFGSDPPRVDTWDDGNPKKQLKITGILMSSGFKSKELDDGSWGAEPIEAGTVIVEYIDGHNRYTDDEHRQSWGQAEDLYGGAPMIGDVVQRRRDADEPGKGAMPRRCHWFNFVAADRVNDAAEIKQAEALYHQIEQTPQAATGSPAPVQQAPAPVTVPAAAPGLDEEEPF
jgi:hypothetical protein